MAGTGTQVAGQPLRALLRTAPAVGLDLCHLRQRTAVVMADVVLQLGLRGGAVGVDGDRGGNGRGDRARRGGAAARSAGWPGGLADLVPGPPVGIGGGQEGQPTVVVPGNPAQYRWRVT